MYRKQDLQYLQDIFDRDSNDIAIVYGKSRGVLSELISDLIRDKNCLYYCASSVIEKTQIELFSGEVHEQTKSVIFSSTDYNRLLGSYLTEASDDKKLVVFDNFRFLIKENPTLINFLSQLLFSQSKSGSVMVVLADSDVSWVENDMVKIIGRKSSEISGIVKLNDFTPTDMGKAFPQMPLSEVVGIYAVIGGMSGMYNSLSSESTQKDVILDLLSKWSGYDHDPDAFLPRQVREPSVYNSILTYIASNTNKLNDLHKAMDIDRAKLSVYLRNLIEADILKKAVSAKVGDGKNTVKGMYLICDRLTLFYYRYVFPRLSSLHLLGPERFYRRYIEKTLPEFMEEAYPLFCMEQVKWAASEGMLSFKVSSIEDYYDKDGAIDFVIIAAGGAVIACSCRYRPPHMSYKAYEDIKKSVRKNKIECDNYWLFSVHGFDQKLSMSSAVSYGLKLIEGLDQRLR